MQTNKKFCNLHNLKIIKSLFIVKASLFLMSRSELVGEVQRKDILFISCVSSKHVHVYLSLAVMSAV
jgi:hypothetical protein